MNMLIAILALLMAAPPSSKVPDQMTILDADVPLAEENFPISKIDALRSVPLLAFEACSTGRSSIINSMAIVLVGNAKPSTVYVCDESGHTWSAVPNEQTVSIDLNILVPGNCKKTIYVTADYPARSSPGEVQAQILSVSYKKAFGEKERLELKNPLAGPVQHLLPAVAQFSLVEKPVTLCSAKKEGDPGCMKASFKIRVRALGDTIRNIADDADAVSVVIQREAEGEPEEIPCQVSVECIQYGDIADHSETVIMVRASVSASEILRSGPYRFRICKIAWTPARGRSVSQTWGLPIAPELVWFTKTDTCN